MVPKRKPPAVRRVIHEAVEVLQAMGVPLAAVTDRQRDMVAMCFLAVAGVTHSAAWPSAGQHSGPPLRTRDIIEFVNRHFQESISSGSYDDIRRKHLRASVLIGIVLQSAANPNASANDPTRGYGLSPDHAPIIRAYGQAGWAALVSKFMEGRTVLGDVVAAKQPVTPTVLLMPDGAALQLGPGLHNTLQRAIVEQFRPRFAPDSQVLYLGDADDRSLVNKTEELAALHIPLPKAGSLPDIILWDEKRGWVLFIEAVHSFGPISPERLIALQKLCKDCLHPMVFVTAFLDRLSFRKFASEIAWGTDVWIADEPDHMIHFNGGKFFGPR